VITIRHPFSNRCASFANCPGNHPFVSLKSPGCITITGLLLSSPSNWEKLFCFIFLFLPENDINLTYNKLHFNTFVAFLLACVAEVGLVIPSDGVGIESIAITPLSIATSYITVQTDNNLFSSSIILSMFELSAKKFFSI